MSDPKPTIGVTRCSRLDDYLAGMRFPLECLSYIEPRAADIEATDIRLSAFI